MLSASARVSLVDMHTDSGFVTRRGKGNKIREPVFRTALNQGGV